MNGIDLRECFQFLTRGSRNSAFQILDPRLPNSERLPRRTRCFLSRDARKAGYVDDRKRRSLDLDETSRLASALRTLRETRRSRTSRAMKLCACRGVILTDCALLCDNDAPPTTNVTCQPLVVHRPPRHRCTRGFIGLKCNKTQLQLHQLQITDSRLAGIVIYLRAVSREPGIESNPRGGRGACLYATRRVFVDY